MKSIYHLHTIIQNLMIFGIMENKLKILKKKLTLDEKKDIPFITFDSTYAHSTTPFAPSKPFKHASANRAPA